MLKGKEQKLVHLSIVVPVYNTGIDKLEQCFQSIIDFVDANSELKVECLVIDDGSIDTISEWCRLFSSRYSSFKFYKKVNEGVSIARNVGLSLAKGKYVTFVDSDDFLISFEDLASNLLEEKYDLIFTDLLVNQHRKMTWSAFDGNSREVNNGTVIARLLKDGTLNGPCCKFIRREFLEKHEIHFDNDMITGEDLVFLIQILLKNPQMYYISDYSYIYNLDVNTSNNRLIKQTELFLDNNETMYSKLLELFEQQLGDKEQLFFKLRATERYIKQLFNSAADLSVLGLLTQEIKNQIELLLSGVSSELVNTILRGSLSKSKLQLIILMQKKWSVLAMISKARIVYLKIKNR